MRKLVVAMLVFCLVGGLYAKSQIKTSDEDGTGQKEPVCKNISTAERLQIEKDNLVLKKLDLKNIDLNIKPVKAEKLRLIEMKKPK